MALLGGLVLLAGCAPHFDIGGGEWAKPGSAIQQTTLDEMDCARTASRAYWTPDLVLGGLVDVVRVKVLEVDRQGRVRLSMRDVDAA